MSETEPQSRLNCHKCYTPEVERLGEEVELPNLSADSVVSARRYFKQRSQCRVCGYVSNHIRTEQEPHGR